MGIYVRSSGVLRNCSQIFVRSSGVLRECKEVYVRSSGVLRKVFSSALTITWNTASHTMNSLSGSETVIDLTVFINGTSTGERLGGAQLFDEDWNSGAPNSVGNPDLLNWSVTWHEVSNNGLNVIAPMDQALDFLSVDRTIQVQNTDTNSIHQCVITATIKDAALNTVVKTFNYSIQNGTPP